MVKYSTFRKIKYCETEISNDFLSLEFVADALNLLEEENEDCAQNFHIVANKEQARELVKSAQFTQYQEWPFEKGLAGWFLECVVIVEDVDHPYVMLGHPYASGGRTKCVKLKLND